MSKKSRPNRLDQAAPIIGHICMEWGRLEHSLTEFIDLLTPLEAGDVSRSITVGMDVRAKVQTIRALSYLRKPSDKWFENMTLYLDYIDNDLRPRRNRIIHDTWYVPSGRLSRTTRQIKFQRPQAFQLVLKTETIVPVKLAELRKMKKELEDLVVVSFAFWYDYYALKNDYFPRALPNGEFRRFVRRAKPNASRKDINKLQHIPPQASGT